MWWLERIKDVIIQSGDFHTTDLDLPPFTERGGIDGAIRDLGLGVASVRRSTGGGRVLGLADHLQQRGEPLCEPLVADDLVDHSAAELGVVVGEVEVTVPAQRSEDHRLLSHHLRLQGLAHRHGKRPRRDARSSPTSRGRTSG